MSAQNAVAGVFAYFADVDANVFASSDDHILSLARRKQLFDSFSEDQRTYYQNRLEPLSDGLERDRENKRVRFANLLLYGLAAMAAIVAIMAVAMLIGLLSRESGLSTFFGMAVIAAYFVGFAPARFQGSDGKYPYDVMLRYFGSDFSAPKPAPRSIRNEIARSGFKGLHCTFRTGSTTRGTFKAVNVELTDTRIEIRRRKKRPKVVFDGLYMSIFSPSTRRARVLVVKDAGLTQGVSDFLGMTGYGMQRARLEDPVFENHFQVYTDDQIGARTILTPKFMEQLFALSIRFDFDDFHCSFDDGRISMFVPFEGGLFRASSVFLPVDLASDFARISDAMGIAEMMIDTLELEGETVGPWGQQA